VSTGSPSSTGSRSKCKSAWGMFDMVGNVNELVADWGDRAATSTDWTTSVGHSGERRELLRRTGRFCVQLDSGRVVSRWLLRRRRECLGLRGE
jgi:hypothetical protein